jgi:hypothetical protein
MSALLVKSETGSIDRFPDGEKLCSYTGLVPSAHLRWAQAAWLHNQGRLALATMITRAYHAIAESKGARIAKVAAARRLPMCCCSVLRNREPYHDPAGHYQASSWSGRDSTGPWDPHCVLVRVCVIGAASLRMHNAPKWANRGCANSSGLTRTEAVPT